MIKKLFTIFFLITITFNSFTHPVHYSITNIEINTIKKEFKCTIKVFYDDITIALSHEEIIKDTSQIYDFNNLKKYLDNFFNIRNDKNITLELLLDNIERKEDFLVINLSFYLEIIPDKIYISNNLLFDIYLDQSNMLILSIDENEYAYMFYSYTGEIEININSE